jgi:hypothetical protein
MEKEPIISYHSGGRTWPHGVDEGSGGAGWCLCNYENSFKLMEKDPIVSYHSGGRTWPHGVEEGSGGAGWCLCNYEQIQRR